MCPKCRYCTFKFGAGIFSTDSKGLLITVDERYEPAKDPPVVCCVQTGCVEQMMLSVNAGLRQVCGLLIDCGLLVAGSMSEFTTWFSEAPLKSELV